LQSHACTRGAKYEAYYEICGGVALMALSSKESNGVLSRENPYLFSIRLFT
jgi:hypothetical protein